jgi:hypothetical protein
VDGLEPVGVPGDAHRTITFHAPILPRAVRMGALSLLGTTPHHVLLP